MGRGIELGLSVGGALTNMAATMISIPIYAPESRIKGILVNKNGQRFINEDTYHGRATAFAMAAAGYGRLSDLRRADLRRAATVTRR